MEINLNLRIFSFEWTIFISKEWVRFGIVILAILATMVAAYWGSPRIQTLLLVLLGGIAGVVLLLRHYNLGFVLIFLGSMFVPYSGPGGINVTVLLVALMVGIWLMDMFVVQREFKLIKSWVLLPIIVMFIISGVAFGMGQIPWFPFANQAPLDAQLGGFAIFALSLGATLVAAHFIQETKWLKIIVWIFIGLGAVYVLGRWTSLPITRLYQAGATGSMFWIWWIALAFAQVLYNAALKRSVRGLLLGIVLVTMYVALVRGNDWKSGWVPPLAAIAVLVALKYKRLVLIAIPPAILVVGNFVITLIASDQYSWSTRLEAWQIVLEISKVNPLFGLGFSNYYWYTPLFSIRGWFVNFNSHSQYVDLIAQVGILGLFCFLWIFFEVLKLSWELLHNKSLVGFTRAYSYGVFAGTVATLVAAFLGDWVLPFIYNIGLTGFRASILSWIFIGGLVALEKITIENKELL